MDAALFAAGRTYAEFKDAMTRNRPQLEANEAAVALDPSAVAALRALPPRKVVVIAEDWCGDVIANLPVLARLAAAAGTLDVRIFDKAARPELTARWRKDGKYESIPVMAFFDESWRELGVFIERPASVTAAREARTAAIYASDPAFGSPESPAAALPDDIRARLMAAIQAMRSELKPWADGEVVRELCAIASRRTA